MTDATAVPSGDESAASPAFDGDTVLRSRPANNAGQPAKLADAQIDDDTIIRASAAPSAAPALTEPHALLQPPAPVPAPVGDVMAALAPAASPAPVPQREPVFAYGFRVNNGRPVSLEAPVLIGRAPTRPRILSGPAPVLARVESPHREVSATHLELRQQGSLVIATDLRSTNGTTVAPPGRDRYRMHQGETLVVQPGTVIDIGDGNLVEILPLQDRAGGWLTT